MRRWPIGIVLFLVAACSDEAEPRPQWVVSVVTDTPIPQLGDRMVLEVLNQAGEPACNGCRRLVALDERTTWPVTFGIAATDAEVIVRARIFRIDHSGSDGLPSSTFVIDAIGALPPRPTAVVDVGLVLQTACFGVESDLRSRATCSPTTRELEAFRVLGPLTEAESALRPGEWAPAQKRPCAVAAPPEMRCLPGGAFVLGDVRAEPLGGTTDPVPERLVQLSPFFVDVDELSVGRFRELVRSGAVPDAEVGTVAQERTCTYLGKDDPANDALPLVCVRRDHAQRICNALGKELPTEAQWEYAATNARDSYYPWGGERNDDPCEHAIIARNISYYEDPSIDPRSNACRVPLLGNVHPEGPVAGGHPADVTDLGVRNLCGNVGEWVIDDHASYTAPCWAVPPSGFLVDPKCVTPNFADHSIRGGSWSSLLTLGATAARNHVAGGVRGVDIGFRCVKRAL